MQYMREQIKRASHPRPKVLGADEISIRKGHTYRIVVRDLERRRGPCKNLPRTRAQDIRQWIANPFGLAKEKNVAILVHGVSLSLRGSGRLDTRLDTPPISPSPSFLHSSCHFR
jgi:hypothetical protein